MIKKQNSPLLILSIYNNINRYLKLKKCNIVKFDLYKLTHQKHFDRITKFNKHRCWSIYNDIENNFYNHKDFAIFLAYEYLMTSKIGLVNCNNKNINIVKELFTDDRFLIDQQLLIEINEELKFKKLSEYFTINSNGVSIIYNLIMDKHHLISPYFFIKYKNIQHNTETLSTEYLTFIKNITLIKTILNIYN